MLSIPGWTPRGQATASALFVPWPDSFMQPAGGRHSPSSCLQLRNLQHGDIVTIIIIHNIRNGSCLHHQVLALAVAMHHNRLACIVLLHLGHWGPGCHHFALSAHGLGSSICSLRLCPLAAMSVSLASGNGDKRPQQISMHSPAAPGTLGPRLPPLCTFCTWTWQLQMQLAATPISIYVSESGQWQR
jgi:hypothetical protein